MRFKEVFREEMQEWMQEAKIWKHLHVVIIKIKGKRMNSGSL